MPVFDINSIPIIGEQDNLKKRVKDLEEKLILSEQRLQVAAVGVQQLKQIQQRLVDRLGFIVSQQKNKRLRISCKGLGNFIETATASLVEYYDKDCDDIVLYLKEDETDKREKTVKVKKNVRRRKK